jgi:hypothetical protein
MEPTGFGGEDEEEPTGFGGEDEEEPTGFGGEDEEEPTGFGDSHNQPNQNYSSLPLKTARSMCESGDEKARDSKGNILECKKLTSDQIKSRTMRGLPKKYYDSSRKEWSIPKKKKKKEKIVFF